MTLNEKLQDAMSEIEGWLCADSSIRLGEVHVLMLQRALTDDAARVGRLPTSEEIELIVTGDDDGEVPEELSEKFKETCCFVSSMF